MLLCNTLSYATSYPPSHTTLYLFVSYNVVPPCGILRCTPPLSCYVIPPTTLCHNMLYPLASCYVISPCVVLHCNTLCHSSLYPPILYYLVDPQVMLSSYPIGSCYVVRPCGILHHTLLCQAIVIYTIMTFGLFLTWWVIQKDSSIQWRVVQI